MVVDLFLVYQFIKRLATPFDEWEAYDLGIIDERGNILINKRERSRSKKMRDAFGKFDLLVLKLKKLLEKVPGGKSRLASYAAALWLIKEWKHFTDDSMLTEEIIESNELNESLLSLMPYMDYIAENNFVNPKNDVLETPTVNVGSGKIAGLGVGPDGEPGVTPAHMKRYKRKNKKNKGKKLRDILGE